MGLDKCFDFRYSSGVEVIGITDGKSVEEIMKFEKAEFVIDDFREINIEKF